jgi:hypothetical protein
VQTLLTRLPDGVSVELLGRLPKSLQAELQPFGGSRVCLNATARNKLLEILVQREAEIRRHLVGLIAMGDSEPLFEGYHLYDYGSPNDSGTPVFLHDTLSPAIVRELETLGALEVESLEG